MHHSKGAKQRSCGLAKPKRRMHHSEWQSIETAPEETDILVFMDGSVFEGRLVGSYWDFPFANVHGCGCCSDASDKPTHWMPLPEPPTKG